MHVETTGAGPPLLLLHGGGVAGWMWRPLLAELGGDFCAFVPDLPGHGRSASVDYTTHDDAVARLGEVIAEHTPGGAIVTGFSLGGQLALRLATERPDLVHGAVVVSAETIRAPLPRPTLALLGWTAPLARLAWFARLQAAQLRVPEVLLDDYLAGSRALRPATLLASVRANLHFDLPAGWSAFRGPAAVLVGARERRLMLDSARRTHEALPGSDLTIAADSAHDIPFTAPGLLAERIRAVADGSR